MAKHGEPPDIRNWSILPTRLRVGFLVEALGFGATILLLVTARITAATGAIVLASTLILLMLVFDSRRSWWPPEPTVPYDPVAANGLRWIVIGCVVILVTVGLAAASVVSF